jgi:hypothetical protein
MIIGGVIQATMGVEAARRDLEDIAPPLSATEDELDEPGEEADPHTIGRDDARTTAEAARFHDDDGPGAPQGPSVTGGQQ